MIPPDLPPAFADALVFVFGLLIGSFLNVCIYRLPRGESVVTPRSHCPGCGHAVAGYDNVPFVSYLLLGGKCRYCRMRISPIYLLVELATGLLFLFLFVRLGPSLLFLKFAVFGALLLVLVMTDWQTRLLPDRVTFPGMALGLVCSLLVPVGDGAGALLARAVGLEPPWQVTSLLDAVLGALAGGGLLFGLAEVYFRLRHKEGMGLGDVKMMTMAGFFLGPKLVLLSIWFASVAGALLGGGFILLSRKDWRAFEIPFGVFLGIAALTSALWGADVLNWYLGYF
ncbi:MAG: prepilin peptidase [Acidobacteria bacterium]|nr:prepilin peptidase [Acidobacteriota bacterium]